MGISEKLTDDELMNVAGGAGRGQNPELVKNRDEFIQAWNELGMDSKVSGMQRAELFDQWTSSSESASAFLAKVKI